MEKVLRRVSIGLAGVLAFCICAFALDPSLDISQYAHTAWKVREGFSKGNVYSIAQTPDGYLWLATELGTLLRFDGVRTLLWQPPTPKHVMTIHTARDGALWIGSEDGLASWKNGVLTEYKEFEGYRVSVISEDREGTVWVGIAWNPGGRMCSVRGGKVQCYGMDGSLGRYVRSLCDDGDLLWVYAETGLWQWKPAPVHMSQVQKPEGWHLSHMACVSDQGHSLVAIPEGIQQVVNGKILPNPVPNLARLSDTTSMLRDRDGGLWIGTVSHGLVHIHQGRTDRFTRSDGLSGDDVIGLLEDREGNLWVLTRDGLDRFREFAIPTISVSQGLSTSRVWSVLGARDGSVWIGSNDALHRLSNGQITVYPKGHGLGDYSGSLFEDDRGRIWISTSRGLTYFSNGRFTRLKEQISGQVHSITEDTAGRLWFSEDFEGHQSIGSLLGGGLIERIPRSRLGLKESTIILSADSLRGGLWIGAEDGLAYFKDGLVQKLYTSADGLPPVNDIYLDGEGTVWAGTDSGLARLRDGRLATLTTRNGLPCNHVSWVREDDDHSFWILLRCGLARISRSELEAWAADTNRTISATIFDNPDGMQVRWSPSYGYSPIATKSKDGRLWFTNWDGVSVIDPRRLLRNELPPPVHIEQIAANGKVYWQNLTGAASSKLQLPPRTRDLEIEFTALSLALPEKVRFRYKLEGQDPDWKEVINDRRVQYSNLAPGNYRFRVAACNNSGVWNEQGESLDFSVAPAYYQTNWFRALCGLTFLATLWTVYQLRVHVLEKRHGLVAQHQVEVRALNEQLIKAQEAERMRISGELHDGVLQGITSLTLRLGKVRRQVPPDSEATATVTGLQRDLIKIGTDIRHLSHELHPALLQESGLPAALSAYCEEFSKVRGLAVSCETDESVQELSPGTALCLYRIAQEALGNAAKYSEAKKVEVRLTRADGRVRLSVSDDGVGCTPTHIAKSGGLGVINMRERVLQLKGTFEFDSAPRRGTTVKAEVPFRPAT